MSPKVSICCATYGHEPYIRKALDSVLMQKVDFEYEVLIGEDSSPDNSRSILKEYEDKFPEIIKVIYRDENVGATANVRELYSMARGEYICTLELDDFWISEIKLQTQADFLDTQPEAIAVSMRCIMVDHEGKILKIEYPQCKDYKYTFEHFKREILPSQTAGIMYRNIYDGRLKIKMLRSRTRGPGDRRKIFSLLSNGEIYCMTQIGSAYRYVTSFGNSYSAQHSDIDWADYYKELIDYARKVVKRKDAVSAAEGLYIKYLMGYMLKKSHGVTYKKFIKELSGIQNRWKSIWYAINFFLNISVRKKLGGSYSCYKEIEDNAYKNLVEKYEKLTSD